MGLTPSTMLTYGHLVMCLQCISMKNLDGIVRSYNNNKIIILMTLFLVNVHGLCNH